MYDVAVLGAGPGGYVAAIRCAQLGLKTVLIEKYDTLGGTCLNVGCIPSKTLLDSSHHYETAVHQFKEHGIDIEGSIKVNLAQMIARKDEVVATTTKGIDFLMDKNKVEVIHGKGSFVDAHTLEVVGGDGKKNKVSAKNIIIATGSKPATLPFAPVDKERIITSTEALKLKEIPKHLLVIGGGVIGLELGQVYHRLGAQVTVIEYMDGIIPGMDKSLSKELLRVLKKQKMQFALSHKVSKVTRVKDQVVVEATDSKGNVVSFEGDYCLVAIGRKAYTDGLGLDQVGIHTDERGRIQTNEHLQTNIPHIYALGDVVKGAMLAHKAEEEGVLVAETIAGQKPHINYNLIPGVVYTWPEVAGLGQTEE